MMGTCADFLKHARAVFQAHPVTEVALSDRHPSESGDWPPGWWRGPHPLTGLLQRHHLPPELWDLLPGPWEDADAPLWRLYPDGDSARAALSAACVAHGRSLAGLPPLPASLPAAPAGDAPAGP